MASINYAAREISVKIVYYGPGLSGKTTNLQVIHRKIPTEYRSDMVSLATETDRTLFFDFLPLDLGKIKGFTTKFQLYTVPGQVYYNATRKLVLRGVDGLVFVVDSAADKVEENLESFRNLEENLAEYGYQRENIPIILQYNKRDLPNALSIEELTRQVNKYNLPYNEAVAAKGVGVFESLKLIGKIVLDYLNKKYNRQPSSPAPAPAAHAQPAPQAPRVAPAPVPAPQRPAAAMADPFAPPPARPSAPHQAPAPAPAAWQPPPPPPAVAEDPFLAPPQQPGARPPSVSPATATRSPSGAEGGDDYYNYGSIKLESMEQPKTQAPVPPPKSNADFEIETYQREIEKRQQKPAEAQMEPMFEMGTASPPDPQQNWQQQPASPAPGAQQQWYAPPPVQPQQPPQQQWQQQAPQQWQQPASQQQQWPQQAPAQQQQQPGFQWNQQQQWQQQPGAQQFAPPPPPAGAQQAWPQQQPGMAAAPADEYNVYNVESPQSTVTPHAPQTAPVFPNQQPNGAEDGTGGDDALFFTSVDTDRARKPKKPVNPKTKQNKGFLGKLFSRNNP